MELLPSKTPTEDVCQHVLQAHGEIRSRKFALKIRLPNVHPILGLMTIHTYAKKCVHQLPALMAIMSLENVLHPVPHQLMPMTLREFALIFALLHF